MSLRRAPASSRTAVPPETTNARQAGLDAKPWSRRGWPREQLRAHWPHLTLQQVELLKEVFQHLFDTEDKGYFTRDELYFVMSEAVGRPTAQELDQVMIELDSNGDSVVDFPEFLTKFLTATDEQELLSVFHQLAGGGDDDRVLTLTAVERSFQVVGDHLSDEDRRYLEEIFKRADRDGNGRLDIKEFTAHLEKMDDELFMGQAGALGGLLAAASASGGPKAAASSRKQRRSGGGAADGGDAGAAFVDGSGGGFDADAPASPFAAPLVALRALSNRGGGAGVGSLANGGGDDPDSVTTSNQGHLRLSLLSKLGIGRQRRASVNSTSVNIAALTEKLASLGYSASGCALRTASMNAAASMPHMTALLPQDAADAGPSSAASARISRLSHFGGQPLGPLGPEGSGISLRRLASSTGQLGGVLGPEGSASQRLPAATAPVQLSREGSFAEGLGQGQMSPAGEAGGPAGWAATSAAAVAAGSARAVGPDAGMSRAGWSVPMCASVDALSGSLEQTHLSQGSPSPNQQASVLQYAGSGQPHAFHQHEHPHHHHHHHNSPHPHHYHTRSPIMLGGGAPGTLHPGSAAAATVAPLALPPSIRGDYDDGAASSLSPGSPAGSGFGAPSPAGSGFGAPSPAGSAFGPTSAGSAFGATSPTGSSAFGVPSPPSLDRTQLHHSFPRSPAGLRLPPTQSWRQANVIQEAPEEGDSGYPAAAPAMAPPMNCLSGREPRTSAPTRFSRLRSFPDPVVPPLVAGSGAEAAAGGGSGSGAMAGGGSGSGAMAGGGSEGGAAPGSRPLRTGSGGEGRRGARFGGFMAAMFSRQRSLGPGAVPPTPSPLRPRLLDANGVPVPSGTVTAASSSGARPVPSQAQLPLPSVPSSPRSPSAQAGGGGADEALSAEAEAAEPGSKSGSWSLAAGAWAAVGWLRRASSIGSGGAIRASGGAPASRTRATASVTEGAAGSAAAAAAVATAVTPSALPQGSNAVSASEPPAVAAAATATDVSVFQTAAAAAATAVAAAGPYGSRAGESVLSEYASLPPAAVSAVSYSRSHAARMAALLPGAATTPPPTELPPRSMSSSGAKTSPWPSYSAVLQPPEPAAAGNLRWPATRGGSVPGLGQDYGPGPAARLVTPHVSPCLPRSGSIGGGSRLSVSSSPWASGPPLQSRLQRQQSQQLQQQPYPPLPHRLSQQGSPQAFTPQLHHLYYTGPQPPPQQQLQGDRWAGATAPSSQGNPAEPSPVQVWADGGPASRSASGSPARSGSWGVHRLSGSGPGPQPGPAWTPPPRPAVAASVRPLGTGLSPAGGPPDERGLRAMQRWHSYCPRGSSFGAQQEGQQLERTQVAAAAAAGQQSRDGAAQSGQGPHAAQHQHQQLEEAQRLSPVQPAPHLHRLGSRNSCQGQADSDPRERQHRPQQRYGYGQSHQRLRAVQGEGPQGDAGGVGTADGRGQKSAFDSRRQHGPAAGDGGAEDRLLRTGETEVSQPQAGSELDSVDSPWRSSGVASVKGSSGGGGPP